MIFCKQVVLGLGVAYAASAFPRVGAIAFPHVAAESGDEKSPPDTIARKLADKAGKGAASNNGAGHSDSSSKAHKDPTVPVFVASASCAGDCISANYSPDSNFLTNAIQPCDANSLHQQWDLLQHGTFTMVKSVGASADSTDGDGWCVGVVPQGVGHDDMCNSGAKLGLVTCGDPASQWYPTDGQLLSALCWSHGVTSLLTAEGCNELSLSMTTATDGATVAITRAETFMVVDKEFIESIPPPAPTYAPTTPAPTPTETYTYVPVPTTPQPTDASDQPSSAPTPTPTTVVQQCGESFTNKKVALSADLTCPDEGLGPGTYPCAIKLDGPEAEIDCNDNTVSQEASNHPYWRGICLSNGATARNCNVNNFWYGISVSNDAEVVKSVLSNNYGGIDAVFDVEDSKLTITDTEARNNQNNGLQTTPKNGTATVEVKGLVNLNSNDQGSGFYNFLEANVLLNIVVTDGATLNQNSNKHGFFAYVESGADVNVIVEDGGVFSSCANTVDSIKVDTFTASGVRFLGDGEYTCDQSAVVGTFVVEPVCQTCIL